MMMKAIWDDDLLMTLCDDEMMPSALGQVTVYAVFDILGICVAFFRPRSMMTTCNWPLLRLRRLHLASGAAYLGPQQLAPQALSPDALEGKLGEMSDHTRPSHTCTLRKRAGVAPASLKRRVGPT